MYSFEQLKVFVTVCESGSFSAAARKLKRAQSGVSQAISNLEIAINQPLFNREKNTPALTENGKALLPIAKSLLHQQKYFDQKVEALAKEYEHELVIAIDESLISDDFLQILAPLANQFPITNFEIITASTFDIEELVRSGQVQLGIVYADGELKVDMDFFLLGQARFLTISSPEHELTRLSIVQDADLKRYRQCVHRSAKQKELWFSYGISAMTWYANTHQILVGLVQQGIGWANVPELRVKESINQGKIISLPVAHEYHGWLTSVGCLVSRSHAGGPVLESLIELLQRYRFIDERWELRDK
ncbi:LysR family transcriptional regulator [Moritella sp. F3]|uniref:LysR family transcriptional regulator n=1 Tax=Moritella sp. F3 TaxID=2718882 RepID=UPI0018E19FF2|nr:LysR family transcriptional regulator [Moritella sp. F3]GIC75355.1 LysR family transcriptional regulator [Moritella sp. F1]GIC80500.1 LysR family transcriptional regulator [Moritella sp. F3]